MSADLVRRWRRLARESEETAARVERGELGGTPHNLRGYAEALNRCADSLERSLRRAASSRSSTDSRKGAA